MKIIWGINVPYIGQKATFPDLDKNQPCNGKALEPVWVPCIRTHKQMYFEICDVCGSGISKGRLSRGITTCCPKCNAKKWDIKNGLVIEKERNANGVRPSSFWQTISGECFARDNYTCQHCHKTDKELKLLQETDRWFDPQFIKTDVGGYWRGKIINKGYRYTNYVLNCHHIKAIKDGGNNRLENLITLCGKCHKAEHSRAAHMKKVHRPLVPE